jgi:hypothetical protein
VSSSGVALASLLLFVSAATAAGAEPVEVRYRLDQKAWTRAARAEQALTFELFADSACTQSAHVASLFAGDAALSVEAVKLLAMKGAPKPPKTGELRALLDVPAPPSPAWLRVTGDAVAPIGGGCQLQPAQGGPAGPPGAEGPTGAEGSVGATGATGSTGAAGPTGADGPTGPDGIPGPNGLPGPTGPVGATGPTGPMGPQGFEGLPGQQGPPGPTVPDARLHAGMLPLGTTGAGGSGNCFLGDLKLTALGSYPPPGTMVADGRLLPINATYVALFALLGTDYGGDGASNFALPDLSDAGIGGATWVICTTGSFPINP